MNLKWWSRSSEPASVPAEPLRELPASQPAETTATEVAEAAASQPAAQADAADPQAVDPEVAPLDAQVQAFTGRVAAAGEARHPRVEPSVPESDSTAGPAVESPADPPASQPAVAQGPAGPRDAEPPAARGPQPAAAEESSPTIFGPEPEKPAKPPAEAATGETEATMSGGRTTSIVLPAEPVRASATPVPTAAVVGPPADRPAAPLNVEIVEVRPVVAPPAASDSAAAVNPANQPANPDTALGGWT